MTMLGSARSPRMPLGFRVAPKSQKDLEELAEGIRPRLPKVAGAGPWKIDAWRVLEQALPRLQYNYRSVDASVMKDLAGFTDPEAHMVLVRQDVYDGLFEDSVFSRSTVVHEFSHIELNHAATVDRSAPVGQHEFYEDSEWQANSLMAAIMMPLEACVAARSLHEFGGMCGTSMKATKIRFDRLVKDRKIDPNHFNGKLL